MTKARRERFGPRESALKGGRYRPQNEWDRPGIDGVAEKVGGRGSMSEKVAKRHNGGVISTRRVSSEGCRTGLSNASNRMCFHLCIAEISPKHLSKTAHSFLPNRSTKTHVSGLVRTRFLRRIDRRLNRVIPISRRRDKRQTVRSTATMPAQVNGRRGNTKRCKVGWVKTRYPKSQVH
jgi:hypothetical protein